jgi:hypothetical protein
MHIGHSLLLLSFGCHDPARVLVTSVHLQQLEVSDSFRPPEAPQGEQPQLTLMVTRVATQTSRMASTGLRSQEDGSFALPFVSELDSTAPPYWSMNVPPPAPRKAVYTADLLFELEASWLSAEQHPPLTFRIEEEDWDGAPEVCLWFEWCIAVEVGHFLRP